MKNQTKLALHQSRTAAIVQQAKTGAAQWDEKRETLTLQITAAFFDTELGDGIGFYEADAIDDYMPYEERYAARQQDERVLWERNLAAPERVSCGNGYTATFSPGSALSFMDGTGRRFALPCYMLWALQDNPMTSDALMSHLQESGFYEGLNLNAEEQAALYALSALCGSRRLRGTKMIFLTATPLPNGNFWRHIRRCRLPEKVQAAFALP